MMSFQMTWISSAPLGKTNIKRPCGLVKMHEGLDCLNSSRSPFIPKDVSVPVVQCVPPQGDYVSSAE